MDFPEETWIDEDQPEPLVELPAPVPIPEPPWVPLEPTEKPPGLPGPITDAKSSKGPKGFIRGFQNMSRRVRKATTKAVTKLKNKTDNNNNDGDGQSRFYVDLGLEEFHIANTSTTCW